jgi:hypothetical protein
VHARAVAADVPDLLSFGSCIVVAVALIVVETLVVDPLLQSAPEISLGVVYLDGERR